MTFEKVAKDSFFRNAFEHDSLNRSIEHFIVVVVISEKIVGPIFKFWEAGIFILFIVFFESGI